MCFLLDHANSNSVISDFLLFQNSKPFPLNLPLRHLISTVSNYFSYPLILRNSRAQLNLRTQTIFRLSLLCAVTNVWEPAQEINFSDVNFYLSITFHFAYPKRYYAEIVPGARANAWKNAGWPIFTEYFKLCPSGANIKTIPCNRNEPAQNASTWKLQRCQTQQSGM